MNTDVCSQNEKETSALDSLVHLTVYFKISGKEDKVVPLIQWRLAEARHPFPPTCFASSSLQTLTQQQNAGWHMGFPAARLQKGTCVEDQDVNLFPPLL